MCSCVLWMLGGFLGEGLWGRLIFFMLCGG